MDDRTPPSWTTPSGNVGGMDKFSRRVIDWGADNILGILSLMIIVGLLVALGQQNATDREAANCKDAALGILTNTCPNEAHVLEVEEGVPVCRCSP